MPLAFGTYFIAFAMLIGCGPGSRDDLDYSYGVLQTIEDEDLQGAPLSQFESVEWGITRSEQLRRMIVDDGIAQGRKVLEIETETGLIALLCLQQGATKVVASDTNPAAIANAKYNAARMEMELNFEVVDASKNRSNPFAGVDPKKKFDLILVDFRGRNSPEDVAVAFIDELPNRLTPGGRCIATCGRKPVLTRLLERASETELQTNILHDAAREDLPEEHPEGVLIEVR
ncbi:MAG: methyltransferase domain-containing protein [Planctomycetota bacterium]